MARLLQDDAEKRQQHIERSLRRPGTTIASNRHIWYLDT
jgi:hypothetical protein